MQARIHSTAVVISSSWSRSYVLHLFSVYDFYDGKKLAIVAVREKLPMLLLKICVEGSRRNMFGVRWYTVQWCIHYWIPNLTFTEFSEGSIHAFQQHHITVPW